MQIRKTRIEDLPEVMELYAKARVFMEETGNGTQWGKNHPPVEMIEKDIEIERSYVCEEEGELLGVFYFETEAQEVEYQKIYEGSWLDDEPYAVIHRITAKPGSKGVASFCVDYASSICSNIRIDTHRNNLPMQKFLKKKGFSYCGIIYLLDGDERLAYQRNEN